MHKANNKYIDNCPFFDARSRSVELIISWSYEIIYAIWKKTALLLKNKTQLTTYATFHRKGSLVGGFCLCFN